MVDGGKFLTVTATSTHPPGFPTPPAGDWPGVLVPADAVNYLLDVAQALGSPANGTAVGPFAVMVPTARPTATPLALPPGERARRRRSRHRAGADTDGDVATGVVLEPGDEFEVTASGTITAPEFLAEPHARPQTRMVMSR